MMILVDLDESDQKILKSLHIARQKGVKNRVFWFLRQKGAWIPKNSFFQNLAILRV